MVFILEVWIFSSVSAIMSLLKLLIVCGTGLGLLLVIMMSRQNSVDDLRYKLWMTTFCSLHWQVSPPREPVARVRSAAHHQVRVPRVSPSVPELWASWPRQAPGPGQPRPEVTVHHGLCVSINDVIIPRGHWQQATAGRVQRSGHHTQHLYPLQCC